MHRRYNVSIATVVALLLATSTCKREPADVRAGDIPSDVHRAPPAHYQPRADSREYTKEVLRRIENSISRGEWQAAIESSIDGLLTVGFDPDLTDALAFAYGRSGEPVLALAALLGGELDEWLPDGRRDLPGVASGAREKEPSAAGGHRRAIDSATGFFLRLGLSGDPGIGLLLDYLGRRYKLSWTAPLVAAHLERARKDDYLRLLTRIADPRQVSLPDVLPLDRIDRVTIPALYCDVRPVPSDYFASMYWSNVRGGYDLTHAVLALQWMKDLRCIGDEPRWRSLHEQQVRRLHELLRSAPAVDDLFIESVAMLFYAGDGSTVSPAWMERIARAQQADGGWRRANHYKPTNDHTTLLALWALLEYSRPKAIRTPMVLSRAE